MRTTLDVDEALLREAKLEAVRSGRTLTAVIEDALRESMARKRAQSKREPIELPVVTGPGVMPGVDLSSTAALFDLLDADDTPKWS